MTVEIVIFLVGVVLGAVGLKAVQILRDDPELRREILDYFLRRKSKVQNYKKGLEFEEFVVEKFKENYFKLLHWSGDKISTNGRFALNNMDPDLEVLFDYKGVQRKIAIECKYRSEFINDRVTIASENQLARYKRKLSDDCLVYIALGTGGLPSKPEEFYLIPVESLKYPSAPRYWLQEFRGGVISKFFYEQNTDRLKV